MTAYIHAEDPYDLYQVFINGTWVKARDRQRSAIRQWIEMTSELHDGEWNHPRVIEDTRSSDVKIGKYLVSQHNIKGGGSPVPWRVGKRTILWIQAN
jgi:hypothetical protein